MNARLSAARVLVLGVARDRSNGWKSRAFKTGDMSHRVELMRQQYLDGTLEIDEHAVARRILLRVLGC
jgi:anti-sigma28 factor (negative regulator of flagellin synthesis)